VTEQNRERNILEELERASSSREAAEVLFRHGFLNEAVSRLYYCLLYHVRALLLTEGLEPGSHEAALRMFALHFVKNGPLPAGASHTFSKLMKLREEADYNPSYSFTVDDFTLFGEEADALAARIRALIRERGYGGPAPREPGAP
jgi:uncharacterized protein (UPF0332 family)